MGKEEIVNEVRFLVGESWKGEYDQETEYGAGNVVQDAVGLSIFRSKKSGNVGIPLTDTEWWFCIINLSTIKSESNRIAELNQRVSNNEETRILSERTRTASEETRERIFLTDHRRAESDHELSERDHMWIEAFKAVSTTYSEMVSLRNQRQLIPGKWYRITDYYTTVNPHTNKGARSLKHPFDIIVLAETSSSISENAYACHHDFGEVDIFDETEWINVDVEADYFDEELSDAINNGEIFGFYKTTPSTPKQGYNFFGVSQDSGGSVSNDNGVYVPDGRCHIGASCIVKCHSTNEINGEIRKINGSDSADYFAKCNLSAWELKYKLENVQWSLVSGSYVSTEDGYFVFSKVGTIEINGNTYILWKGNVSFYEDWCDYAISESDNIGDSLYAYYDDGEFSDDEVGLIEEKVVEEDEGKGTITWMKDEFDNEAPYDFKNIQFKRWLATDENGRDGIDGKYMVANLNSLPSGLSVDDEEDYIWAFTFSSNANGGRQTDYSLGGKSVNNNVFKKCDGDSLPNNVLYGEYNCYNTFGFNCTDNSIGLYFQNNSIGNGFNSNSIGNGFNSNSIGEYFRYNSIGNSFVSNTIGLSFQNNSIGNDFAWNSIGNNSWGNSIGNSFAWNSIGNDFYRNTIGNGFNSNSIGNDFYENTIGNGFAWNSIGNWFVSNTIGNSFISNTIGNACNHINIQKSYVYYVIIENGNQYINITSNKTTSASNKLRNFTIAQGVNNSNTAITISHNTVNDTFKTTYQNENSTVVYV